MNNKITLSVAKQRLNEAGLQYIEYKIQNGFSLLCTKQGGRILGPFLGDNGESILWMNSAFESKEKFSDFLKNKDWNIGGDRLWILPEMPLFVEKRADFDNTYIVPPALDPGNYDMTFDDGCVSFSQNVSLGTYEVECKRKDFYVKRCVSQAENPLRNLKNYDSLMDDVAFCGIEQSVLLRDQSEDKSLYLESWLLSQINPGGKLLVPMTGDKQLIDYYEPMDKEMCKEHDGGVEITSTGIIRFKLGFLSSQVTGRSGYMGRFSDGGYYLFIRNYSNLPSNVYCGDSKDNPELRGCSLFYYNGFTEQGGFSEYEHSCTTISGDTGISETTDKFSYYFFVGEKQKLDSIAKELLGFTCE